MLLLNEIMSLDKLQEHMREGLVRFQVHPEFNNYWIMNYTETASYNRVWDEVTLQCRGLIVDWNTKIIVARPFDKFFNYGEPSAPLLELSDEVEVTDKLDGSLGILYRLPNGSYAVASRGSFASEQALHATALLKKKYWTTHFSTDLTYMFEIIYPQNRIVLDYGDMDDLVMLGARDIYNGDTYGPDELLDWHGPRASTYRYKTLQEALEAPARPNREGYVVYSSEFDRRLKIKQEDYIALHKIVTGLTKRRVWENLSEGKTMQDLLSIVPDEWHDWLTTTANELIHAQIRLRVDTMRDFKEILSMMPADFVKERDRKLFAMEAVKRSNPGFLFKILDGGNIQNETWDAIKPRGDE